MTKKDKKIMYKLFRDLEDVYASSYTSIKALESFIEALKSLNVNKKDMYNQVMELSDAVCESEPKIFPLNHIMKYFEHQMQKTNLKKSNNEEIREYALKILQDEMDTLTEHIQQLIKQGEKYVQDGDFIILYSVSMSILQIILKAKEDGKNFRILVLEQDVIKTKELIKKLKDANVEYQVVPSYNLSHYIDHTNKLFLGGVTVTYDNKVITSTGTSNVVSLSHVHNVPVYLFIKSLKFSHKKSSEQNIHCKTQAGGHTSIEYDKTTHSHDTLKLDLIDRIIIEKGEIKKKDISKYRCDY